jgi:hypothetical protein
LYDRLEEAKEKGQQALKKILCTQIEQTPSGGQHWIYHCHDKRLWIGDRLGQIRIVYADVAAHAKEKGWPKRAYYLLDEPRSNYGNVESCLELIKAVPKGTPWFIQVNFTGPHDPMDITERMARECRSLKRFPPPVGETTLSPEHLAARQNYSAMIENIDRWLGTYLEKLRERGDLDSTVVVWSSDHGEMLGDRGAWGKSKP